MQKLAEAPKARIDYVSWLQFLGVAFVVFGHSMNSVDVPLFFTSVKAWVYVFHMPLFFLVSAYLFAYKGGFNSGGYRRAFSKRFTRLLAPYFIWNAAFILPKVFLAPFIEEKVDFSWSFFSHILLYPRDNILGHTWFLFALFEMFVLAIVFEKLRAKKQLWIPTFAVLAVAYCFGVTDRFLSVGDLLKNGVFFWIGLMLGSFPNDKIVAWGKNTGFFISLIVLTLGFTVVWICDKTMLPNSLALGICVLILFAAMQIKWKLRSKTVDFISKNSFAIYIMHWPVMMVVRLVVYTVLAFPPVVTMACMFVGGLAIPAIMVVVLQKCNYPPLKKCISLVFGM